MILHNNFKHCLGYSMSPDVAMINHNAKSTMFSWAFKILVIVLWTIILLPIDLKLSYSDNGIKF